MRRLLSRGHPASASSWNPCRSATTARDPDLRDVGTKPEDIKNFLRGYATEYAKAALASSAPADSVLEDAAQVEIDLFNDLNRIYGNTLTAYAKEMCRLGYRKNQRSPQARRNK
jgi:hypothetical protein